MTSIVLGLLSDVHAHRSDNADDIERLVNHINTGPSPDMLLLAGDISHRTTEVVDFLGSITLSCPKCWVPGNHDVWVINQESVDDSPEHRYKYVFPKISEQVGWHYLPLAPFNHPEKQVAVVGTIGWFTGDGYSEWFDTEASELDLNLAMQFALELDVSLKQIPVEIPMIVVTHHVGHRDTSAFDSTQGNVWSSFLQDTLEKHSDRVSLVFHGHRHVRYGPEKVKGMYFVAHPFGYPHQHDNVKDGYRMLEVGKSAIDSQSNNAL